MPSKSKQRSVSKIGTTKNASKGSKVSKGSKEQKCKNTKICQTNIGGLHECFMCNKEFESEKLLQNHKNDSLSCGGLLVVLQQSLVRSQNRQKELNIARNWLKK